MSGLANDWEAQTSAADIRACEISLLNLKAAPFWPKNGLRSNLIASKFHNIFRGGWGGWGGWGGGEEEGGEGGGGGDGGDGGGDGGDEGDGEDISPKPP